MAEESTNRPTARRTERLGKYEIIRPLATGGMGIVYQARDVDLDRLVALKILQPDLASQQTTLIRFYREARAAAKMRHENIVTLFDVGEINGTHFLALEFIEGTDLQDYINRKCRLDPEEARQIMIQATRALAHAHEQGIVHRDIKPSNFLLTQKGNRLIVKLTDFGLAIRNENDAEFRITKDKTTVGTIDYMSPEQARDSRSADIRSDIYSLGCTFYHMLAGLAPFARGTLPERLIMHMRSPPDVKKLGKGVPDNLVSIISRMLAKKPDDRYPTPAALLFDLENPDKVAAPDKSAPTGAKLVRGPARKQPIDPTQVVEEADVPAEEEPVRQVKTRSRKKLIEPVEKEDDDSTEEVFPPETRDELWAPDSEDPEEAAAETDDAPKKKTSRKGTPVWMYAAGGTAAVLVLLLVLMMIFGGRTPPPEKPPEKLPNPVFPIVNEKPDDKDKTPIASTIDTAPAKMSVAPPPLPIMDLHPDKADPEALRREYYGPFSAFPEAPAGAVVLRVSRLAANGPGSLRTLSEAFAQAKANEVTVIEIHDNGPIPVQALTAAPGREIVVRGGNGYRPLLVWELPKISPASKAPFAFCTLAQGRLILENLDFVMQWYDKTPAAVFDLAGTDFYARACTFSVAGDAPQGEGVVLLRRHGAAPEGRPTLTWLQRCYMRGADLSLLLMQETIGAALIEESLVVGYQHPLIDVRGRDKDALDFYSVRSTWIAGRIMLRCMSVQKGESPKVAVKLLDSIVSRDDATSLAGDMLHAARGVDLFKMSWRSANTAYAGWLHLLKSDAKTLEGSDLAAWRRQWLYRDGDRTIAETWPNDPPSGLAEQDPDLFRPQVSHVAFAALTGAGSIGCVIGRLPPAPQLWIERTITQGTVPNIPISDFSAPPIEGLLDFYGGERIELAKVPDFGKYLTEKLKGKHTSRVVVHLAGKGVHQTSPLRVKGVEKLILYCEPNPKDPITFDANAAAGLERAPLIDMVGGHLELIGVRIRLSPASTVPTIAQVQGGNLSLTRCWLQGPHGKSDFFQNLISVSNDGHEPTTLLLRDNVLSAGKLLIKMQDHVQLQARNNVFLALGAGVQFDAGSPSLRLTHLLDHNTWAVRQSFFSFKTGPEFEAVEPVTLHANSNAFLQPFADDADKGVLLRGAEAQVASGQWHWRGRFNVYDSRMHAYFGPAEKPASGKQTRLDWQVAWGQFGEHEPLLLTGPAAARTIAFEKATQGFLLSQLDKLALPIELRGDRDQTPPGADLVFLGIKKK